MRSIPRKGMSWLMYYGEARQLGRGDSGEGTLAEPGFGQNVSEFILVLSPRGTDKLEAKSDGIGGLNRKGPRPAMTKKEMVCKL